MGFMVGVCGADECLPVPAFGRPPEGAECIDPLVALRD